MNHLEAFLTHQKYLKGVAYRMTGSIMDTEEIVQETYLRWQSTALKRVDSIKAFLTSITVRLCLDLLKSSRYKRELYPGTWLPEPVLANYLQNPADQFENKENLSMAFLLLLERLSPIERAVFILRDIFDYDYSEISNIVLKTPENCRQVFSRSKKKISTNKARYIVTEKQNSRILFLFLRAVNNQDMDSLLSYMTADIKYYSDGGGIRGVVRNIIHSPDKVTRLLLGIKKKIPYNEMTLSIANINGNPGVIFSQKGAVYCTLVLDTTEQGINRIFTVLSPQKLQHIKAVNDNYWTKFIFFTKSIYYSYLIS